AWNETARDYPLDGAIHELIEQQVERTPTAVALRFESETLTYAQLNARANRLACWLRARGVGRDVRVGLLMERSTELVVGLPATLKAGGAYVPLDPSYPPERLRAMVADADPAIILAQEPLCQLLPEAASLCQPVEA